MHSSAYNLVSVKTFDNAFSTNQSNQLKVCNMILKDVGHQTVTAQPHDLSESRLIFCDLLFERINNVLMSNVMRFTLIRVNNFDSTLRLVV